MLLSAVHKSVFACCTFLQLTASVYRGPDLLLFFLNLWKEKINEARTIYLSICLSVCLSVCLPSLSIYLSAYTPIFHKTEDRILQHSQQQEPKQNKQIIFRFSFISIYLSVRCLEKGVCPENVYMFTVDLLDSVFY